MRILFIGLKPSSALEKVLLSNAFHVDTAAKIPAKAPKHKFDLIAYAPKTKIKASEFATLRKFAPSAWIAIAVKKAKLSDTRVVNELLKCESKNDVWIEELWENQFWFSLQSAVLHKTGRIELQSLREENKSLQMQYNELLSRSSQLVDQLERDVGLASNIQRSVLPKFSPNIPGISLAVKYVPAAGVGGDYYDIFEFVDGKRFGILIADSKTHGMAAALLSVLLKVRLEEMKDRFPDSRSFVEFLNREIHEHQKELASLSLLYGILDRTTLTFQFTVAGHLRPILWRAGELAPVNVAANPPLGESDHFGFRENSLALKPGDLLIFYTDGLNVPLALGKGDENVPQRLVEILKSKKLPPEPLEIQNELMAIIDRYVEKKALKDDVTLIHFSVNERALYLAPPEKNTK